MLLLERLGRGLVTYFRPRRGAASFGGFPLLKPAVISQLEGGGELEGPSSLASGAGTGPQGLWTDIDIQTDNNLTEEMYEEKYNISHELQRNSFQETDFSETYILEKKQEVHSVPCLDPKDTRVKKADNCSLMKSCGPYGPEVLTPVASMFTTPAKKLPGSSRGLPETKKSHGARDLAKALFSTGAMSLEGSGLNQVSLSVQTIAPLCCAFFWQGIEDTPSVTQSTQFN
ncbi:hypothetical protein JEQ12_005145 [Ovis aries]|uniref:Uncharacterized protein n=1 Tax=Ovis aries TaxID=9940 RepID=A0A835ZUZ3_SHEEP|nr:hypothetical protein JEQ12_005145 [Ovis aries]